LLGATQEALRASGQVYVIENVAGAKMPVSMLLCGSMFGLRTYRHRKFEIALHAGMLMIPDHPTHRVRTSTKKRMRDWAAGMNVSVTGDIGSTIGGLALDIDWMTGNELSQAIPPAYTQFIGEQLIEHLARNATARPLTHREGCTKCGYTRTGTLDQLANTLRDHTCDPRLWRAPMLELGAM
jgi:DNA (cytosine-5)-methyltransferase 1